MALKGPYIALKGLIWPLRALVARHKRPSQVGVLRGPHKALKALRAFKWNIGGFFKGLLKAILFYFLASFAVWAC